MVTVWMKKVLHADSVMMTISADNSIPCLHPTVRDHILPLNPHKLWLIDHDFMMDEINWREIWNYNEDIEANNNDSGSESSADDEGDEEEVEESKDDTGWLMYCKDMILLLVEID